MTIQELENMITQCKAECTVETEILNGLYSSLTTQQGVVDKLKDKLKRLCSAAATLEGIEE